MEQREKRKKIYLDFGSTVKVNFTKISQWDSIVSATILCSFSLGLSKEPNYPDILE